MPGDVSDASFNDGGDRSVPTFEQQLEDALPNSLFITKLIARMDGFDVKDEELDVTIAALRSEIVRLEQLIKDLGNKP